MLFFSKYESAIFLFHRIHPIRDSMWDPIDPILFEQCLSYISKHFFTTSLNEVIENKSVYGTKPMAAITFDDGYRDFIDYSLPILDKYKFKTSIFLTTGCIDNNLPVWTYVMDYLFFNTHKVELKFFDTSNLPLAFQQTKWKNKIDRIEYGKKLKQHLKYINASLRNEIIEKVNYNFSDVVLPSGLMMSWLDIINIHEYGVQIGSHSATHPTLDTLESDKEITFELKESAGRILKMTGIKAEIFSYPNGSYNKRVMELTQKAGYKYALAVNKKPYHFSREDDFSISRIELYNENWIKTKARIDGSISFTKKMIKLLK